MRGIMENKNNPFSEVVLHQRRKRCRRSWMHWHCTTWESNQIWCIQTRTYIQHSYSLQSIPSEPIAPHAHWPQWHQVTTATNTIRPSQRDYHIRQPLNFRTDTHTLYHGNMASCPKEGESEDPHFPKWPLNANYILSSRTVHSNETSP